MLSVSWLGHRATLALTLSICLGVPLSPALFPVLVAQRRHHPGEEVVAHSAGGGAMAALLLWQTWPRAAQGESRKIKGAGSRESGAVSSPGHAGAKRAGKAGLSLPPRLTELERDSCAAIPHPEPFQPSPEGECCLVNDVRCPGERLVRS